MTVFTLARVIGPGSVRRTTWAERELASKARERRLGSRVASQLSVASARVVIASATAASALVEPEALQASLQIQE